MQAHRSASGTVFKVRRKKGEQWYVKYRIPDASAPGGSRQVKKILGPAWTQHSAPPPGFLTKKMAEAVLRGILVEADHGKLAIQQAVGVTFADACNEWLRYVEHDRKRRHWTVRDYKSVVTHTLIPRFGKDTPLSAITAIEIDSFREDQVEQGKSPATINKYLRILHGIFKRAMRAFDLRSNPVKDVERQPNKPSGDFDVLAPAEVMALARAATSDQDSAIYTVAAFSGLRLGELRALDWKSIDFSKRIIHVRRSYSHGTYGPPKSGLVRSVPMVDAVVAALDKLSKREFFVLADDLVFCNEVGSPVDESALRRRFKVALKSAGLAPIRFHDLRHSFGTLAVQAYPLSDVKAYMGHSDVATTMRYVHHVPRHDAADKLSKLIASEAGTNLGTNVPALDGLKAS